MKRMLLIAAASAAVALGFTGGATQAATGTTKAPTPGGVGTVVGSTLLMPNGDYVTAAGGATPVAAVTATTTACGYHGYSYEVKYHSAVGITVWTYRQTFAVYVCGGLVRSVNQLYDEVVDTCCGWAWDGNVAKSHTPLPYTDCQSYTRGNFGWIKYAYHLYPWIKMTIGYTGGIWSWSWGIAS